MLELKDTDNDMLWICKALLAMEVFFLYPLKVEGNAEECGYSLEEYCSGQNRDWSKGSSYC